jgi:hypothetical protein
MSNIELKSHMTSLHITLNFLYKIWASQIASAAQISIGLYCGYPGLGIQCKDGDLQLGGDSYRVSNINYTDFTVSLVDQEVLDDNSCPRVDHNVTFPQFSWLSYPDNMVDHYLLFFLNCTFRPSNISPINCGSFAEQTAESSFVLLGDEVQPGKLARSCQGVFQAPILQLPDYQSPNDSQWINGGYGDVLGKGFHLPRVSSVRNRTESVGTLRPGNSQAACAPVVESRLTIAQPTLLDLVSPSKLAY